MEKRLKALKEELEYLYAVWNFIPSLAIVGGGKGYSKKEGLEELASEIGIKVYFFDSLERQEMQRMIKDNNQCRKYMVIRVINGEEEINPIEFIEEVLRDAIGY